MPVLNTCSVPDREGRPTGRPLQQFCVGAASRACPGLLEAD
jgi:hypothetical protein